MRCKKHFTDFSSSVGVCASCLRERLFSLIAAQAKASQSHLQQHQNLHVHAQSINHHRKSDANINNQPPLIFPRSVSPYINRRKSDNSVPWPPSNHQHHHYDQQHKQSLSDQRFYNTPQIGPSGAYIAPDLYKKKNYRFSLITNIFRSKSHKRDTDVTSNPDSRFSITTESATSSSWFSGILTGLRRKQSRLFSLDETTTAPPPPPSGTLRIHPGCRDRGMSPARLSEDGEDDESGYSSETSNAWKQTPVRGTTKPSVNRPNHGRTVSGLAFCLSPLVRASPNRHWMQPETAFSGEIRVSVNASAFCKNRSRKLADFGRSNPNH